MYKSGNKNNWVVWLDGYNAEPKFMSKAEAYKDADELDAMGCVDYIVESYDDYKGRYENA